MEARLTRGEAATRSLLLLLLLVAALGACTGRRATPPAPPMAGTVVARVNGSPIFRAEVDREAAVDGFAGPDAFSRALDERIDRRLLAAEAVRQGLDRDPSARRRLAEAREHVLDDLVLERQVSQGVTEASIDGLYAEMVKAGPAGAPADSLETARPRIVRFLTYDRVKDLVLDLRHDAKIVLLVPARPAPAPAPGIARP